MLLSYRTAKEEEENILLHMDKDLSTSRGAVSYTHLRAHETA